MPVGVLFLSVPCVGGACCSAHRQTQHPARLANLHGGGVALEGTFLPTAGLQALTEVTSLLQMKGPLICLCLIALHLLSLSQDCVLLCFFPILYLLMSDYSFNDGGS